MGTTTDLKNQRSTVLQSATDIIALAKSQNRDLTSAEVTKIEAKHEAVEKLDRELKGVALVDSVMSLGSADGGYTAGSSLRMAMTGRAAKSMASAIAEKISRPDGHGRKALVTGSITLDPAAGVEQVLDPLIIPRLPTSLLELLSLVPHQSPQFSYLKQVSRDSNAAIVPVGGLKPTSLYSLAPVLNALKVFAHVSEPVDEYLIADNTALQAFLQSEMLYGLTQAVEAEVLNGDGTDGHLTGILSTSGIQTVAAGPDAITTLRTAATQLEVLGFVPGAYVIHPTAWAGIETARNTNGSFDLGGPVDRAERKAWGTTVVLSTRLPVGTAVALDLGAVAVDTDTSGIKVAVSEADGGFEHNSVRIRTEGRYSVSVFQPAAVVKIAMPAAG